jgi:hypothetical protein
MQNFRGCFFCLILAIVFSSVSGRANEMGVQAGASFNSFFNSTSLPGPSNTTDLYLGGFYEANIIGPLNLQPELAYRGAGNSGDWAVASFLGKAKFPLNPFLRPYVFFGPEFAVRLSNSSYKSTEFALSAGAGLEFTIAPAISLLATGRYSWGLSELRTGAIAGPGTINGRRFYLTAGIGFDL